MISPFRLQANRRNALRSTGPKTEEGKQRSRANALRHGLTAETIVASLEDAEDYKAFEAAIISDYCAETAVARELVLRLASLLWRLRRATAIETQLLEMQMEDHRHGHRVVVAGHAQTEQPGFHVCETEDISPAYDPPKNENAADYASGIRQLAYCFLRLAEHDAGVFKRLNRYEAALWRQAVQIIYVLSPIRIG